MNEMLISYPTGWTLAVVDDEARAREAVAAVEASGLAERALVIAGNDAGEQLRQLGASSSRMAKLRRSLQFMTMDQLPDLFVYEAALADGRAVVGVRVPSAHRAEVVRLLQHSGAHFLHSFGSWMTTEISQWRGPMPPIPQHMQR